MLAPGDEIGDWVVETCLGEGGMGAVFRAHNRLVPEIIAAVKVMKPVNLDDARERFLREVRAVHKLQHPSIVRITGFGEDRERGLLWMAMDLIEGGELGDRLGSKRTRAADAIRLFDDLVDALAHAHGLGIFHRDLKPSNVLIDERGRARLVDFGIAAQQGLSKLTATGLVVGTPAYLPPEIFDAADVDPAKADVYAIGQMLCELLTGEESFPEDPSLSDGQRMGRLVAAKARTQALDPGEAVPPDVRALIRDATAPDPDERIPTALALQERMRRLGPETRWVRVAPPPEAPQGLDYDSIREDTWGHGEPTWDSLGDSTEEAPRPAAPTVPIPEPEPEAKEEADAEPEAAPARRGRTLMIVVALGVVAVGLLALVLTPAAAMIGVYVAMLPVDPPVVAHTDAPAVDTDVDTDVDTQAPPCTTPSTCLSRFHLRTRESGVKWVDTVVGEGETLRKGQKASVAYTGWLQATEAEFDSRGADRPMSFDVGSGRMIPGWEDGVLGMRPGGTRWLVIPPDLAYGARGQPPRVPPNSTLVFKVELLSVEDGSPAPISDAEGKRAVLELARTTTGMVRDPMAAIEPCTLFKKKYATWLSTPDGAKAFETYGRVCHEVALVGTDAPPLKVDTWFQGKPTGARARLLVFWEPWDRFSQEELPKLNDRAIRLRGRLDVIGITSLDRGGTPTEVRRFIDRYGVGFPLAADRKRGLFEAYEVSGVPAAALVRNGKIVWRGHPRFLTDEQLQTLLNGG